MKRWQAIAKIVELFVEHGHPGYAFAALISMLACALALAGFAMIGTAGVVELIRIAS
jgi:hypothetical protein